MGRCECRYRHARAGGCALRVADVTAVVILNAWGLDEVLSWSSGEFRRIGLHGEDRVDFAGGRYAKGRI
ncbi:protein of unknown function (plasmid) [Pararobbsia alpina]